jgi:hypothetical protein
MSDEDLLERVRVFRSQGCTPKQVARSLGVPPGEAARLVREVGRADAATALEPPVVGSWVSPGWRRGLDAPAEWPDAPVHNGVGAGLVSVLVARQVRHGKVSVSTCLVDVYCLGVKDAVPPRVMDDVGLGVFKRTLFRPYEVPAVVAPIEMARELVWGAVSYARHLGFQPHPDFKLVSDHLGAWEPTGVVRFGCDGKPCYTQGPFDDATLVMRTLARSVGEGNFNFLVSA